MSLRVFGKRPVGREQKQLGMAMRPFVKGFDLPTPSCMLAVVDLAAIQNLALNHLAAVPPLVSDIIPIAVLFAVFEASVESQEHANHFSANKIDEKILGLHYRRFRKVLH